MARLNSTIYIPIHFDWQQKLVLGMCSEMGLSCSQSLTRMHPSKDRLVVGIDTTGYAYCTRREVHKSNFRKLTLMYAEHIAQRKQDG